jgi:hypothetical protein
MIHLLPSGGGDGGGIIKPSDVLYAIILVTILLKKLIVLPNAQILGIDYILYRQHSGAHIFAPPTTSWVITGLSPGDLTHLCCFVCGRRPWGRTRLPRLTPPPSGGPFCPSWAPWCSVVTPRRGCWIVAGSLGKEMLSRSRSAENGTTSYTYRGCGLSPPGRIESR